MEQLGVAAEAAGCAVVEKVIGNMVKRSIKTEQGLKEDNFNIEGELITVLCEQNVLQHSIYFNAKKKIRGKRKFPGKVLSVELTSLIPPKSLPDVITMLSDGFEIRYRSLPPDIERFVLDVWYEIEAPRFIDKLVSKEKAKETPKETIREYWMAAQLKCLKPLEKGKFSDVSIKDLDFLVAVDTHEDVGTTIPSAFKEEIEIIKQWQGSIDREEKHKLDMRHIRLKRATSPKKDTYTALSELQKLFMPRKFRQFVDVKKDFFYYTCYRGKDYHEFSPYPTWPKYMDVVSRTNLSRDNPAAEGKLIYEYKNLRKEVESLVSKWM